MRPSSLQACVLLLLTTAALPAREPKPRAVLTVGKDRLVYSLALSPDGKRLAATIGEVRPLSLCNFVRDILWGTDTTAAYLWAVDTGKLLGSLGGPAHSVAFSPDGKTLAVGEGAIVRVWDVGGDKPRRKSAFQWRAQPGYSVASLAFSPDGKTLAAGEGTLRLWDVATGEERAAPRDGADGLIYSVAFSPDGKTLAARDFRLGSKLEDTVTIWDVTTGKRRVALPQKRAGYGKLAISPDGKVLAFGVEGADNRGVIALWDMGRQRERGSIGGHEKGMLSVAFSPDGRALASGGTDGTIKLWEVATGKELATLRGHTGLVYDLAFGPDGKTLASGSGEVCLWDVAEFLRPKPDR